MCTRGILLLTFAIFSMSSAQADPFSFVITDLGADLVPAAINNSGQVVGSYRSQSLGFLWSSGSLMTLGGPQSQALDINDAGIIAGSNAGQAALFSSQGGAAGLGLTPDGNPWSATSLNNAGQVVGVSRLGGSAQAFMFSGTLPPANISNYPVGIVLTSPNAINNNGQIVGLTLNPSAYIFAGGAATDIGSLPGATDNTTDDINDLGHVVGRVGFGIADAARPALWAPTASVLPTLSGCDWGYTYAFALNNDDHVVGQASCMGGNEAVLWVQGFSYDLTSLIQGGAGWQLSSAADINDRGQITGQGMFDGVEHGFLLTPVAPVTEPSSFSLVIAAVGVLICKRAVCRRTGTART